MGGLCQGEIFKSSQWLGDGPLCLLCAVGARAEILHLRGVGRAVESRVQPLPCFT